MINDLPELREKLRVFKGREDAGEHLAGMLKEYRDSNALVLAIPAGGVPVAASLAERLGLAVDVAVVSKITPAWNTEVGFGAVAFDGTVRLNEVMAAQLGLSEAEIKDRIKRTASKVRRRAEELRGERPLPDVSGRAVFLVDDGIASGFTIQVAVEAVKSLRAGEIMIAVPTGHEQALVSLAGRVKAIYCANVRSGYSFAVADAYQRWSDVDETQALEILERFRMNSAGEANRL